MPLRPDSIFQNHTAELDSFYRQGDSYRRRELNAVPKLLPHKNHPCSFYGKRLKQQG